MKHALLRTLPGRAIVVGLAIKIAVLIVGAIAGSPPSALGVLDTVASLAVLAGGSVFVVRGLAFAKRRLLWRVRRKLIISYIFIGFVPAILIIAFFMLGGLLLFSNFTSYLVQSNFRTLTERAEGIASTTAAEMQRAGGSDVAGILDRRQAAVAAEFPGASLAAMPMTHPCGRPSAPGTSPQPSDIELAGPWSHVEPPQAIPDWIPCEGFSGLLTYERAGEMSSAPLGPLAVDGQDVSVAALGVETHALVRAVAFPETRAPRFAVVVDLLVNDRFRQQLRQDTGAELTNLRRRSLDVAALPRKVDDVDEPAAPMATGLSASASSLEYVDWTTGKRGGVLVALIRLSISEVYQRISSPAFGSRQFGQVLFRILIIIGVLFLIIEAGALVTGLVLAKSITGSVHELFVGTERVRQGDFASKIAVVEKDQLGELSESFNQMTASIEDLLRQAAEKKRLEEELRIAHEIQMSLLPQGPLKMPGLSVTALCVPAREVGGDYYDFLPLDDHRVGVLIADVSGKGTSAALYMAELKGLVLSLSLIYFSPRELLIAANRIIAKHLDARSFITMTYAVIDLGARTMTYARAGHCPLIYAPASPSGPRLARVLAPDGLVLGLKLDEGQMFERILEEETIPLREGDLVLFFTDGITEAMDPGDDCFGEARLGRLIEQYGDLPPDALRERVLGEIASFVNGAPQHDDMTMILLKVEGLGVGQSPLQSVPIAVGEAR